MYINDETFSKLISAVENQQNLLNRLVVICNDLEKRLQRLELVNNYKGARYVAAPI
jgi:hypothetical protein